VTAFVATASKGAMAALLVRLFAPIDLNQWHSLFTIFAIMAAASMIAGNILALMQDNIKRLLAYSSIAHMGYLLTAFLSGGQDGAVTVTFYLTAYAISIMGCFCVITLLSTKDRDADSFNDIQGLFHSRPWLSGVFSAMLLSLAGIPLTAGFIGKFFVVTTGVKTAHWWLVITLALTSGIGLFYYLRIIITMFSPKPDESHISSPVNQQSLSPMGTLILTFLSTLLIWLGTTPSWFMVVIRKMVG
jgi:NADH-quinone oxidoreductase subunit N